MSNLFDPTRPSYDKLFADFLVRIRRMEAVPHKGHYQIKVFADDNALDGNLPETSKIVVAGDGKFIFGIPDDLALAYLWDCFAYVTTVGSDDIVIQIRNVTQAVDMLSVPITIEAGDFTSYQAALVLQPEPNTATNQVARGDLISIDIDGDGGGTAMGLGVGIELNPAAAS